MEYCRGLTTRWLFRHEYEANDFTVYMYRPYRRLRRNTPGQNNDRGEGAQGGCFLGRKKDLFERFFPAATRRGAGIFCCPIFEEIRVLYTIEHLVHPRQRIAVDMMDRI